MRLTSVQIAQFRKFRQTIAIRDLAPGLNLFTGPNEAGKSTIAAAIRAAFFERHRSNAAEDFRPFADRQATPAIMLEFTAAGVDYRLFKQFLGRARCTLEFGARRLDGEEAEDYLAKLLGYQYASRGRSKADVWGIPGLLWTEQGRMQDVDEAINHAVAHLRAALGAAGDKPDEETSTLIRLVMQERNALLTSGRDAPTGEYAKVLKHVQQLQEEHVALVQEAAHYRQAVDRLAELQAAHQADVLAQPWQAIRAQQHAAQAEIDEARQWAQHLQVCEQQQRQWEETATLFQNQLRQLSDQTEILARRRAAHTEAQDACSQVQAQAEDWEREQDQANAALVRAQQVLDQCRRRDQRAGLQQQRQALAQQADETQRRLAQADAAHQALQDLQIRLAGLHVDDADLSALRKLAAERDAVRIRQQAHATRLRFNLEPGSSLSIDGTPLHGTGEHRLTDAATLHIPGTGTLHIQPGGEGLESLRQTWARLEDAWTALLRKLRAPSQEAVETRHLQASALHLDCARHEQTLRLHAPEGIDALRRELSVQAARQTELDKQLAQAHAVLSDESAPEPADVLVSTAQAQSDHQSAQTAANAAREGRHRAQLAVGAAQARVEHAARELQAAQATVDQTQHSERIDEYQRRLVDARAQLAQSQAQAETLREKIAATRADILAQDVERYRASADHLQAAHQQRHEALLRLDTELRVAGARGVDEREAALALELAQAQRRAGELARRARALDHLLQLLRTHQRNATQALQQPLQAHLRHYLDLLFPGAHIALNDQLQPDTLQRADAQGQRLELLDSLSYGAREQLGLIGRVACADLLRQAGRPVLLMLDDALVHADPTRLAQMKRILFDAATRHQILLFSCHEAWWRDMGIAPRDVATLVAGDSA